MGTSYKLAPARVIFVKGINDGERTESLKVIYKEAIIAQGNAKTVRQTLKGVFETSSESKLIKALDDLLEVFFKSSFRHKPTSGAIISETTKKGTYLVGAWPSDLKHILRELKYPVIDDIQLLRKEYDFPLPGGQRFNLLNVSEDVVRYFGKKGGFFNRVNTKWIDAAVKRGEDIFLMTSKKRGHLYRKIQLKDGSVKYFLTGFGKEVHRLEWKHGYRFDFKTKQMLPPNKTKSTKTLTKFNNQKIVN